MNAYAEARTRPGLVGLLLVVPALGWWWLIGLLRGMDEGPWSGLGTLDWFLGVWLVMMAAMMLPSVAPAVVAYARVARSRSPIPALLFVSGYLVSWLGVGLGAYLVATSGRRLAGNVLDWDRAGRWVAGVTLIAAAVYGVTPLKDVCLSKCRNPLASFITSWRAGPLGAVRMGAAHGAFCVGCCWALMLSLFALGVMSLGWTAFIAALIALEKIVPWRELATYGVTAILVLLGFLLLAAPEAIPGLMITGSI